MLLISWCLCDHIISHFVCACSYGVYDDKLACWGCADKGKGDGIIDKAFVVFILVFIIIYLKKILFVFILIDSLLIV